MLPYGRRLMVEVLEVEARENPNRAFASVSKSADLGDGFEDITFLQMKRAVDVMVGILREKFHPIERHETLAFMGVPDLRYNIVFFAALKCRMKVMLPSPRNPPAVNISLLEQTNCTRIVYTAEVAPAVRTLLEDRSSVQVLALEELLSAESVPVGYDLSFIEARDEPILVLHSSGSTGNPKPVTMTHGSFAAADYDRNIPPPLNRKNHDLSTWDFTPGSRIYVPFPPFHLAGFYNNIMVPVFTQTIPILGPALRLPSGKLIAQVLRSQDVRGCFLPPSLAADLYNQSDGPDLLKRLSVLIFAGGPLSEQIGNELIKHVSLRQFYGSTEVGQVRQLVPRKEHWQYLEFHPDATIEFQSAEDDAYELVVFADDSTTDTLALGHNLPGIHEFRTKDLFRPHPSLSGLWKFHARRDDILVLSSGEKFNAVPLEGAVCAIDGVSGAIVVGDGKPRLGLLVELESNHNFGDRPISSIWPSITALNAVAPPHGRILRSMVYVTDPTKPFVRAGKGTIVRKATTSAYKDEIDSLFDSSFSFQRKLPQASQIDDQTMLAIFQQALENPDLRPDDNLVLQGLDSITSIQIIDSLKKMLRGSDWISLDLLYSYDTVKDISKLIAEWQRLGRPPVKNLRKQRMQQTMEGYENQLLPFVSKRIERVGRGLKVALIGSTGYLGKYLLQALSRDSAITLVYCLNRSPIAAQQWADASPEDCTAEMLFERIDFRKAAFGLSGDSLERLKSCDVIVHSAWQVNFVLPLSAFGDSLQGLIESLNLASSANFNPLFMFISSIASTGFVGSKGEPAEMIPEVESDDLEASMKTGYGESKLIGERLVSAAASRSHLRAAIIRLGQIAPPREGNNIKWPAEDGLRAILSTSKLLHAVPTDLVDVHWIPVDTTVCILQDLIHHGPEGFTIYNTVNPRPTLWNDLVPTILEWCGKDSAALPLQDWLDIVKKHADAAPKSTPSTLPAIPLLAFFELLIDRGESRFQQDQLLKASRTARVMSPIDSATLQRWAAAL